MISLSSRGEYKKTLSYLTGLQKKDFDRLLDKYGEIGVRALADATPVDTGLTASSWKYRIVKSGKRSTLEWYNTNVNDGTSVAILIQYGHGTGTGGYIEGKDYINPAIKPVFDKIADEITRRLKA